MHALARARWFSVVNYFADLCVERAAPAHIAWDDLSVSRDSDSLERRILFLFDHLDGVQLEELGR